MENKNNYKSEAELKIKDNNGLNFDSKAKIRSSPDGEEFSIDYYDAEGKKMSCIIDKSNPDGIGNTEACQMLKQAISTNRQALRE